LYTEIISTSSLEADPKVEEIEDHMASYNEKATELKQKKADAESQIKCTDVYFFYNNA
jgi:hypothetical protein